MSCYYSGRIDTRAPFRHFTRALIPIPRPFATVTVTCARVRNIVCRPYTNITRVILTRVIFNPGQNGASVDAAIHTKWVARWIFFPVIYFHVELTSCFCSQSRHRALQTF